MGTAIKHPVPARVKPSFATVEIRALFRSALYPYGNSERQRFEVQKRKTKWTLTNLAQA